MKYSFSILAILASVTFNPANANDCVDTGVQGDGWGWNGVASCQIDIPPTECIDFDGDGWGWDGVQSCLAAGQSLNSNDAVFEVPPTGQTISYVAGDDADQETNSVSASRFTDNGNGTFDDDLTGLTWLGVRQCIFEQTWSSGINYVNQLSAGVSFCTELNDGSSIGEWRLPNINEFQSLVDYAKQSPVFASGIPFTGAWDSFPWGRYWSSTSFVSEPSMNAWILDSNFGQTGVLNKSDFARVFAVRD